uniref:Vertebrate heat shock transcription factor C-terminal domain-containing protein n=1 Tax=Pelodiscus sinensis TaxID=13735 RepID=K7G409_PELSI
NSALGAFLLSPLMLNDSSSAHSMPKYSRQYSLEHVHGTSPYAVSVPCAQCPPAQQSPPGHSNSPAAHPGHVLSPLLPGAGRGAPGSARSSPVVRIKEEPPSPTPSPQIEEARGSNPPAAETPLSPSTFIDSILQESQPSAPAAGDGTAQPPPPGKCLSVACLDNNAPAPHLAPIDSSLDNLQAMLSTHGFSVDTSALLDLFSPSMTVTDMNLPDLDSSLASIQDLLSSQEQQKPAE